MRTQNTQQGYSLIEVLIALTILMIAIVAPITIAIKSLESSTYSLEQNTAVFLAQEAISLIEAARNEKALQNLNDGQFDDIEPYWDDWVAALNPCRTSSGHGCNFGAGYFGAFVDSSENILSCSADGQNCRMYRNPDWPNPVYRAGVGVGGVATPFTRRVFLDSSTDAELVIRVVVEWDSEFLNRKQQVSLTSALYNVYGSNFVQ